MSLKAKIEAVIYASEEPVTLTQLAGLLGQEAQAELDRAASAQQTLSLEPQALSLNETEAELEAAAGVDPSLGPDYVADSGGAVEVVPEASEALPPTHDGEAVMNGAPSDEAAADSAAGESAEPDAAGVAKAEKARAAKLRGYFRSVLDELIAEYATPERGLEIREVAGGFRFATKPEYHDAVRGFVKSLKPPLKLSLQALETLAVVAYKQPVTAPEISEIRGVDSSGVLGSLIARKLITTAGRKHVIGRPILYKTTKDFLVKFGLKDVAELPSIEEFEKMAGQMAEQEEIPMDDEMRGPDNRRAEDGEEGRESVADEVVVDGRISGLPPIYDDASDDPSEREAEIQSGEPTE